MPTITNLYGLPQPMVAALTPERHKPEYGRIGITTLIDAPLRRILTMQHFDAITEDASENLWALLGKAAHYVLDQHTSKGASEERIEFDHPLGMRLVGVPDYYHERKVIDYKVTSVWSFILGDKIEWENQLNTYAYLYSATGLPADELWIYAILRDWQKTKTVEKDYPAIPFIAKQIPLWPMEKIDEYVNERVRLHIEAEYAHCTNQPIPYCTKEERWTRPYTYAVIRDGATRAYRVFDTRQEAQDCIDKMAPLYSIVQRPGADVRCDSYCVLNTWCPYYTSKEK